MGGWLSVEAEETLEHAAAAVARAQILAQHVWPDLMLRLGVPRDDEDGDFVVIARFAGDDGEAVRMLSMGSFRTMKRAVDAAPPDMQGIDWRRLMGRARRPPDEMMAHYSEYAVPRAAAALFDEGESLDKAGTTRRHYLPNDVDEDDVKEDEYLLMSGGEFY